MLTTGVYEADILNKTSLYLSLCTIDGIPWHARLSPNPRILLAVRLEDIQRQAVFIDILSTLEAQLCLILLLLSRSDRDWILQ